MEFPPIKPPPNTSEPWSDPWDDPARAPPQAFRITLDETHVYWSTLGGRMVRRAPKEGGSTETVNVTPYTILPDGIAVDGARVYFGSTYDSTLESAPKGGGAATVLFSDHAGGGMFSVALDDTHVYWAVHSNVPVRRMSKAGGDVEVVSNNADASTSIALDDTHVYWACTGPVAGSGWIARALKEGGGDETIALHVAFRPHLTIDDEYVYWVTQDDCRVQRAPKQGGPTETLAEGPSQGHCFGIAVDEAHVFWASALDTDVEQAGVWRAPKGGGERARMAEQDGVYGLAVDEAFVYFPSGDHFRRAPK